MSHLQTVAKEEIDNLEHQLINAKNTLRRYEADVEHYKKHIISIEANIAELREFLEQFGEGEPEV